MKTATIKWNDFFANEPTPVVSKKAETIIKVAFVGLTTFILFTDVTFAASSIDTAANAIYRKLLNIGKWVIIIKGGIDTIQNAVQGELQSAKKNFLGYLLVYVVLWALPWGLKQVDLLFSDMGA